MASTTRDKRQAFQALHRAGCFVIPNPWDAGSAIALQSLGFPALATTSAGMAWSMGRPDGGVPLDEVLGHLSELAGRVDVPVNADFENGFAAELAVAGFGFLVVSQILLALRDFYILRLP